MKRKSTAELSKEDRIDSKIAKKRLSQIKADPKRLTWGKLKVTVDKRGPWKGHTQIHMPKVSWLEMEARAEAMWDEAIKEAIKITKRFKTRQEIISELKRQLIKKAGA